jgi:hypothetical protein
MDAALNRPISLPQIGMREKVLVFMFCNFLSLDFKAKVSGGNPFQLVLVVLTILSGVAIAFQNKDQPPIKSMVWATALMIGAVVLNFINIFYASAIQVPEFDVMNALRMSAALILPPVGLMVVHTLARRGYPLSVIMNPLLFAALVNAVWRFIVGRRDEGPELLVADTRWEILSPILFVLVGVGLVGLLFNQKIDWLGYLSLVIFVFLAIASATRSLFLSAFWGFLILPPLWLLSGRLKDTRFVLRLAGGSVACILAVSLAVTLLTSIRADAVDALLTRNKSADYQNPQGEPRDLTLMLREAQVVGMRREMAKNPYYVVFGRGLGVPYYLDRYYEGGSVPSQWFFTGPADFSDLGLLYLIYSLGWTVGGALVVLMAVVPLVGVWAAAKLSRQGFDQESVDVARAAVAVAAFFALNFTWAGTYERGSMLVFGILTGVILVGLHRAKGATEVSLEDLRIQAMRKALAAR